MTAQLAPRSAGAAVRAGRLTDAERAHRAMKEIDLQRLLVGKDGLAVILGWEHVHIRPGMRAGGQWRTSTSGSMAVWPDLVLVRPRDRRLIFAELKRELEHPTADQERTLDILRSLSSGPYRPLHPSLQAGHGAFDLPWIEVHVWRPSDLADPIETSRIYEVLR